MDYIGLDEGPGEHESTWSGFLPKHPLDEGASTEEDCSGGEGAPQTVGIAPPAIGWRWAGEHAAWAENAPGGSRRTCPDQTLTLAIGHALGSDPSARCGGPYDGTGPPPTCAFPQQAERRHWSAPDERRKRHRRESPPEDTEHVSAP